MTQPAEAPQTAAVESPATQAATHEATDREAMIAAVEASGFEPELPEVKEDGAPIERDEKGKFLPKTGAPPKTDKTPEIPPPPAGDEDAPKSKLAVAIRAREEAQKTRDTAKAEAESFFNETKTRAQQEAERIVSEARAQAQKELGEWRAKLKSSPLSAIKDGGIDAKQLVDEVTREGSPEWQAQKRLEAKLEATEARLAKYDAFLEQQTKAAEENQTRSIQYARRQAEERFAALITEDSALRRLYDPAEILAKAHTAADLYREKTGEVAPLEDLRDYLEEQAAKRLATIQGTRPAPGSAAKTKANGPRTPSSSSASERRTSPKPFAELSAEEARDAMKHAAEDAMSAYATKT